MLTASISHSQAYSRCLISAYETVLRFLLFWVVTQHVLIDCLTLEDGTNRLS